ncbi:UPF0158 family protein [Cohnella kolymensis]|uniref:UPF0158 family protein n=1 Tax=Cohnella kolymensis TaxID=1590652 RepID=UPI001F44FBBE|nr:UPF0158 family protein [Cohnella kolymensis]
MKKRLTKYIIACPTGSQRKGIWICSILQKPSLTKKLRNKLFNILHGGRKIFRKFKDALSSDGQELQRYYTFMEERNRERVIDWLESINVKVTIV